MAEIWTWSLPNGVGLVWLSHLAGAAAILALAAGARYPHAPPIFPPQISEWRPAELATYDRSDLFEFIDGGAEVYLAYNFRRLWVQTYRAPGRPEIGAEAYDMGSGEDAYGVLSVDPTGEHADVGQMARYGAGLLRFCKGHWFARVLAEKETEGTRAAVFALGQELARAIAEESSPPDMLRLLPAEGLRPDSTTYFHTQITLNQLYYLSHENLLSLGADTEAVLAEYSAGAAEARLLLVRYPSAARCRSARDALLEAYLKCCGVQSDPVVCPLEDGGAAGVQAAPPYLVAVLGAPDAASARDLLSRALSRLPGGASNG